MRSASRQATMSMRYRSACFDYLSVKNKIAAVSPLPSNTHEKMSLVAHLSQKYEGKGILGNTV